MGSAAVTLVTIAAFGVIRGSGVGSGPDLELWQWINLIGSPLIAAGVSAQAAKKIAAWYQHRGEWPDRMAS